MVGVSNDAVNFLNSAIGSKVASRKVIMIIASLGIFIGATFSSGIMEVARKGIFFPDQFLFTEVMIIFLAVMITDIILLDTFNTFGLPTSTTVSIVFEILGAATVVASMKVIGNGDTLDKLAQYINTDSALAIISGIFLSVGVAFTVGMIVQYLSRIIFSFEYYKRLKYVGAIWSGFALAALTYFLLVKGAKGASFISEEQAVWFQEHALTVYITSFIVWSVTLQVIHSFLQFNILRIVVLFGTFALAMAFAGNDLVNFIGVPIAGMESFQAWSASGQEAEEYLMDSLNKPVQTPTYLLLIAGFIMVLTLWFSKKARKVTETQVDLSRQEDGEERFSANIVSRTIVKGAVSVGAATVKVVPNGLLERIEHNFKNLDKIDEKNKPAFDLVRASVNLTVASMLISLATSLKLPLSTTYVSFMVAMGAALADRAWGRESAAYRVAGVLNVILGWFMTALIAFSVSGLLAFLIYYFGLGTVGVLVIIVIFMIYRTFRYYQAIEKKKGLK